MSKKEHEKLEKRTVLIFSLASFLNDMGSDMIYPLWPTFVTTVIKANMSILGLIDGIGDALNSISKAISGYLSDKIRKRKVFIWSGYLMGSISRIGYAVSSVWQHLIPFKVLDRIGKLRGAPRDALISEVSTKKTRGRNFGILRMMDNLGAVVGILLAIVLLPILGYRKLFILASIPSLLGVLLIIAFIKDIPPKKQKHKFSIRLFDNNYKLFLLSSMLFSLGYFSYSFLLIYARSLGMSDVQLPIFYLIFTATASIFSVPFGKLSDRLGRKLTIFISYGIWILIGLIPLFLSNPLFAYLLFFLYGIQKATYVPSVRAFISELSPSEYRATGIGTFDMLVGLFSLPASFLAGILWDMYGYYVVFELSVVLTILSILILLMVRRK
ncbi:MAG: MFS transporter [Candidatus Aenigmarchaeota archaeon]|nr:MFS transporter [Candidatus Aenigmarchaeota archaeon]